jgi:hypothetical protein
MATKSAAPKPTTIHRSAFAGGQNKDYSHTLRLQTGPVLRVTVHHDTSYPFQSHAKVEVWGRDGWTIVHSLHSYEVTTGETPYVSSGCKAVSPAAFEAVEKTLLTVAAEVLRHPAAVRE